MKTVTHTFTKTITNLSLMTFAFSLALLGSLAFAQSWTEPTQNPPDGNVPLPINAGAGSQTKQGSLTIEGNLTADNGMIINTDQLINDASPTIEFQDTNHRDWWVHVNSNRMYFIGDRNEDNTWFGANADDPWPFVLHMGTAAADDWARFSNRVEVGGQVWANAYCDAAGNNCAAPTSFALPTCAEDESLVVDASGSWTCSAPSNFSGQDCGASNETVTSVLDSSVSCSYSLPTMPDGGTIRLTPSAGEYTSAVTFQCRDGSYQVVQNGCGATGGSGSGI